MLRLRPAHPWFPLLVASALAGLAACKSDSAESPTQVVIDIDAEPSLRAIIAELRIHVAGSDSRANLDRRVERLMETVRPGEKGEPDWPIRIALVPREENAERVFELSATAFDDEGEVLATARLITGYVAKETRYAKLVIEASCVGRMCKELETCSDGVCGDAWRDPASLLPFNDRTQTLVDGGDPLPVPDSGMGPDEPPDILRPIKDLPKDPGPQPTMDAQVDAGPDADIEEEAGVDAGQDAGEDPQDAGEDAGQDAGEDATAPVCEPTTTLCQDGLLITCDEQGQWDEGRPCAFVCIDDACTGECVPDTVDCLEGLIPRSCGDDGEWDEGAACPGVCMDGMCVATCTEGDRQCSGLDLLECSGGVYAPYMTCQFACDVATDQCTGECNPDEEQCQGRDLQVCGSDAYFDTVVTCPFVCEAAPGGQPDDFQCGGECMPSSTECESVTELKTCDANGDWGDPIPCTNQACGGDPNACIGNCSPGAAHCEGVLLQQCNDLGAYEVTDCSVQDSACIEAGGSASCGGDCVPGRQQCSGNRVQTCSSVGVWTDAPNDCAQSNQTCIESGNSAACTGDCAPTQTSCIDGDAHGCDGSGEWTQTDDCTPPDEICRAGSCEDNDPYTVGADSAAGWSSFSPANDVWYVVPVRVDTAANVLSIRLLGRAAGGTARMAMWEDGGGFPGDFVAQTDNIPVTAGVASDAPIPLATSVAASTTYWIGAKFTGNAALYQAPSSSQTGFSYDQAFASNPATTMDPFPIGFAADLPNFNTNFFLLVQDVAQ